MSETSYKRIISSECEWGLEVRWPQDKSTDLHGLEEGECTTLMRGSIPGVAVRGTMTSNGGRRYAELGHPEYAAPENASVGDAVISEIAGERYMLALMLQAKAMGRVAAFQLNKRVIDREDPETGAFHTWGYHANYSARPWDEETKVGLTISSEDLELFGWHAATRNLYCGAGVLRRDGYAIGQKALGLTCDFHPFTIDAKPVVNLRNEPHADPKKALRVHDTSCDPNMSPKAMFDNRGTSSLVLALTEHRHQLNLASWLNKMRLPADSLHLLAKQVATDLTFRKTVELDSGKTIRPLDIQSEILEKAYGLSEVMEFSEEDALVLKEWEKNLVQLEEDPFELKTADWAAKLFYLEEYKRRKDIASWDDEALYKYDWQYDRFGPGRQALGLRLRKSDPWYDWMPGEAVILERLITPPQDTRARVRGEFIRRVQASNDPKFASAKAEWGYLKIPRWPDANELFLDLHDTDVSVLDQYFFDDSFARLRPKDVPGDRGETSL